MTGTADIEKPGVEYWYRFDDVAYALTADEYGERRGPGSIEVHLRRYVVIKHTPKGAWLEFWPTATGKPRLVGVELSFGDRQKRFVLKGATKRFACPTEKEAKESFIARKEKLISIMKARIYYAEQAMNIINRTVCDLCGGYVERQTRDIVTRRYRHTDCVPF